MEIQLKIGILGAGAMGILYGGLLKRLGHDVNLIVRNYNKKKLLVDKGICLNLDLGRFTVYPEILHIKERCRFEVIIVFTKTNDTIEALNAFKVNIDKDTYLMSLQNGLGNLEKLQVFTDKSKIIYGIDLFVFQGIEAFILFTDQEKLRKTIYKKVKEIRSYYFKKLIN